MYKSHYYIYSYIYIYTPTDGRALIKQRPERHVCNNMLCMAHFVTVSLQGKCRLQRNQIYYHSYLTILRYIYIYIYIYINCSWVVTRWQYTFTHKQYTEQHK
jgi:hypothetical protein